MAKRVIAVPMHAGLGVTENGQKRLVAPGTGASREGMVSDRVRV